ncbi:hypothetical protein [Actinomadura macra]|uniref:hypothetical protein n=1 Tax=Actinomadura macra TaxID=46164 RepID=UPI00082C0A11|nr:hypothetical protein [Actinomadura macra]
MRPRRVLSAPLTALLAAAVLAASGCGVRPTGILSAGDRPVARGQAPAITVYLLQNGRLRPVVRPGLPGHPYLSIAQLSVPPTAAEQRLGLRTEVRHPLESRVVDDPSTLIIDVAHGGPRPRPDWSRAALAQIACTADALPGIDRVRLWGAPEPDGDGRGFLRCGQFSALLG